MGTDAPVSQTSEADTNIIPEVSLSTRINDNWTFGLGIFGSAGMGVDYRDTDELFNGYSNLQLMKFAPSLAYNDGNFGIGFAPVIQYGALDINYIADTDGNMTTESVGNGMSSDLGYGFNLGAYFDVTKDFTIGASYQSAISMEYDDQITVAADGFRIGPNGMGTITSDKLEQPAEIKIGAAYNMGNWMITADAKQIKWGDAKGYKDFNWEDQNVFGIGAKYSGNGYWVGAGYNFGSDPIDKLGTSTDQNAAYSNAAIDVFNNHFFPGIVESHFTFGGGYNITKNMAIDAAVVYAAEVEKTVNSSAISSAYASEYAGTPMMAESEHEVTHSQIGYTVSLRMNF
jgi:long-chain fatty acid transport protein